MPALGTRREPEWRGLLSAGLHPGAAGASRCRCMVAGVSAGHGDSVVVVPQCRPMGVQPPTHACACMALILLSQPAGTAPQGSRALGTPGATHVSWPCRNRMAAPSQRAAMGLGARPGAWGLRGVLRAPLPPQTAACS